MGPRYGRRAVAFFKRFFKWIGRGAKKAGGFVKKHWKKVTQIAMFASSAFFTFGASLGLQAAWASKVGALVSKLGISGKMANILSGAIVQATTSSGALIGGTIGAITGGKEGFMRGAGIGGGTAAIAGGIAGAFRPVAPGLPGGQPAMDAGPGSAGNPIGSESTPAGMYSSTEPLAMAQKPSAFGSVWDKVIGSGGIGPIIAGVGSGLARGAEQKAITQRDDERRDSYNIEYKPIMPMFRQESGRILATRGGEE